MIKDYKKFEEFENNFISNDKLSYEKKLAILESMREECESLGVLPAKNPLEGIETVIKIAKVLNSCTKS